MTTTTKIFIILVCLFAFIFTPLAVGFFAQADNWKQLAQGYQDQAENEAAYARSIKSIADSQLVQFNAQRQEDQQTIDKLRADIDQLKQQIAQLAAERTKLALANESQKTTNEQQTANLAIITKNHDEISKSNKDLRASELDLRTRNAELLDKVKELTADKVVLTQQLNQRAQEVAIAREENEALRKQQGLGRAGEYETGGTPAPMAKAVTSAGVRGPVRGQVKAVQGNLATVDVGSGSGVKAGMILVVSRGSDYVCDLVVTSEVSPTEAVGEIKRGESLRIRPGDQVQDEVTFNAQARS